MSFPNLALVIPVYNESAVLPELLRRLTALFDGQVAQAHWTAILVDDGSGDDSVAQIEAKCASDRRFRLIGMCPCTTSAATTARYYSLFSQRKTGRFCISIIRTRSRFCLP
ncbi:glycosyltransferase [Cephaloticoccus primus]|uniref:glycosyltransferase n=1 Tax=Cephaloticoccus primus TaxID=1548207 RepID=UPI0009ED36EA